MKRNLQGSCDEPDQISYNTTSDSEDNCVASAFVEKQVVLKFGLAFTALAGFSWREHIAEEAGLGLCVDLADSSRELRFERGEMKLADIGIGKEHVGRRRQCLENSLHDVWHEMKAAMDGLPP